MRSKTAAKVVMIYSIVLGAFMFIGAFSNVDPEGNRGVNIVMAIAILTLSILGLVFVNQEKEKPKEKPYLITLFVLYCIFEGISLIALFMPFYGIYVFLIMQVVIAVPFSFSIVYLTSLAKEMKSDQSHSAVQDYLENEKHVTDFEQKIHLLKKLKEEGLLSEEEFKKLLDKHLNQNL